MIAAVIKNPWPILDIVIYGLALLALTSGGNLVCRWLLELSGISLPAQATTAAPSIDAAPAASPGAAPPTPSTNPALAFAVTSPKAGRMIGSLERLIILLGLVAGSWEIIAAVIALKTVGRFKELDERLQAEYFLIGSLASIVWAALVSLLILRFDNSWGFHIAELLKTAR